MRYYNTRCFCCQGRSPAGVLKPDHQVTGALAPGDFRREVSYDEAASFLHQHMQLNLAWRGWLEPAYYDLRRTIARAAK